MSTHADLLTWSSDCLRTNSFEQGMSRRNLMPVALKENIFEKVPHFTGCWRAPKKFSLKGRDLAPCIPEIFSSLSLSVKWAKNILFISFGAVDICHYHAVSGRKRIFYDLKSQKITINNTGCPKKVHKFELTNLCSKNRWISKVGVIVRHVLNLDFVKIGQKLTELWLSEDRITERAETRAMKYW